MADYDGTADMKFIAIALAVLAFAAGRPAVAAIDDDLPPGRWRLSTDGELFSMAANDAPVEDILLGIRNLATGDVRVEKIGGGRVSARYYNVTLNQLLSRLGIEYVLVYRRGPGDFYELESGWVSYDDRPRVAASPPSAPGGDAEPPGLGVGAALTAEAQRRLAEVNVPPGSKPGAAPALAAPYPVSVRLDGEIRDWPAGLPWQRVSIPSDRRGALTNEVDAAVDVAGLSDGTNIFFAMAIEDDARSVTNTLKLPLDADDNVTIDLSSSKGPGTRVQINRHHILVQGAAGLELAPKQYVSQNNGTKAVLTERERGWAIEMTVPVERVGKPLNDRVQIGLSITLIDMDAGEKQPRTLHWSGSTSLGSEAAGSLVFVDVR